ncbi:nuclear factor NF-kappa-B p105 subunit-like [Cotesia typhae]|uniref:nuclear factor NF-kappa-B p105 subunit-like n=1 Tax=Cotesia typhae TaxID=2053667 RepID=UPI003D696331
MVACNCNSEDLFCLIKSGKLPILHYAIEAADEKFIDVLLENKVDLDLNIPSLGTALHLAVVKQDLDLMKKLINSGADVNAVKKDIMSSYYKWSTLHLAIFSGNARIVEFLLKNNATIEQGSEEIYSSLRLAIRANNIEILQLLETFGAEVSVIKDGRYTTEFNLAVEEDNLQVIKFFLRKCTNINGLVDFLRKNLLHKAVKNYSDKVLKYLLNSGMDFNLVDKENCTPLNLAIKLIEENPYLSGHYRKIVNLIENHVIKMRAANFYVSEAILKLISVKDLVALHEQSIKEVHLLKETKIADTNLSYFNILNKSIHKLAIGLKYFKNSFSEKELIIKFPIYGEMIFERLMKGLERRTLLSDSQEEIYEIFGSSLPCLIIREILHFLSNDDLKLLIK